MLDQVLNFFKIVPDYDLDIMKKNQTLESLTAKILLEMSKIFTLHNPDYVFVHGDTTTAMACGLACFYKKIMVCHVEAGLRTYNKLSPFPEEMNRQIISRFSSFHFAPTSLAKDNLTRENIDNSRILVTGNTVIDALKKSVKIVKLKPSKNIYKLLEIIGQREIILVTGHRRENFGDGFKSVFTAIKNIASKVNSIVFLYPVHLNPNVQRMVNKFLKNVSNIILINPLPYEDFIFIMNKSKIIITDSGGVQEEAPSLGKPVIVTRINTERPEAVEAGTVILAGTNQKLIEDEVLDLLENQERYNKMSRLINPYGDGKASSRIVNFIKNQKK